MKNLSGFIGVLAIVAAAPLAQASIQISYSINGGAATVCATGTDAIGNFPGISCSVPGTLSFSFLSTTSNSPGTTNLAQQLGSVVQITNSSASTQTLTVWLGAQNFTGPVTPPNITFSSQYGDSSTTGTGNINLTSCVDTSNGLTPPTSTFCLSGPSIVNTQLNYSGNSSANNTTPLTITSLSGTYSLQQMLTFSLGANSNLNFSSSNSLTSTAVPEPASVMLLGGILLGLTRVMRRKFTI